MRPGIQVIARAAAILRACKDEREGLSLGDIAARVHLPRSTVQRIVSSLAAEGLLSAGSDSHSVRIGPELQALGASAKADVVELAHPHLKRLSEQCGETVDLAVLRKDHMVFIDQIAGTQRLRAVSSVGTRFPLHCTANGKAALALLPDEAIAKICAAGLEIHTPATITTSTQLSAEIEEIRRTGISFDREEHSTGICALGKGFDSPGGLIYAVSIPMPQVRFEKNILRLADLLRATVARIESGLVGS